MVTGKGPVPRQAPRQRPIGVPPALQPRRPIARFALFAGGQGLRHSYGGHYNAPSRARWLPSWLPVAPLFERRAPMIQINGESMTLRMKDEVIATDLLRRACCGQRGRLLDRLDAPRPPVLPQRGDHGPDPRRAPGRRLSPTATAPSPCSALVVAMVSARACRSGVAVCTKAESQVTWLPGGRLARHAADTAD
jgi:hypothetical protein